MAFEVHKFRGQDSDPQETDEWREAIQAVIQQAGPERAQYLLRKVFYEAYEAGVELPDTSHTPYLNSIPLHRQPVYPGDSELEERLMQAIRWNAVAMVVAANKGDADLGGHIASYQSSAVLYEVGFNHFWKANETQQQGDLLYIQGHSAPGIYARAFLEGRISEDQLNHFRREVDGQGLSSYPHPYLMPEFWQLSTVSMGLGPIMAIYQARFMKYLQHRKLLPASGAGNLDRKVWAFLGDGETDEPESQGAIALAAREKLDNLIFVINCNLQRLDGPVRGNGKIIQELEGNFRGAGWHVIKVIWGSGWDKLLERDHKGLLRVRMMECVDGEYQAFRATNGAFVRQHFFGKYPELLEMVADLSDEEIYFELLRGGHDSEKVYAAYDEAARSVDKPTVILAKTVKGYGMGEAGEGQNITHQQKKLAADQLQKFAERFHIPITPEMAADLSYYKPADDSPEMQYLRERREALGGYLPSRNGDAEKLSIPDINLFEKLLEDSGEREISTTMAAVRCLIAIARNRDIGPRLVPIVADEARTFGMEGMFRQVGIYAPEGQLYEPVDAKDIMPYREDEKGQILEEGITEAGAISSWIAAATSYANHGVSMIPVYIFYSMFGFQRIGDLAWAAGDMLARGFLIGGTSGRTTLNGEGLQHQDGHSQLVAGTIPNCLSYDPSFAYEVAIILHDGLKRMYQQNQNLFYYITTLNENYPQPAMPKGCEEGILKGLYCPAANPKAEIQLLGCGAIFREAQAAASLLKEDYGIEAQCWSATSFNLLARDGHDCDRNNRLNPKQTPKTSWLNQCLADQQGPVIAASDYVQAYAEQVRAFIPAPYTVLGTDGFGRSDSRESLRSFFEVDRYHIVVAALDALGKDRSDAIKRYQIDAGKPNPREV